MIKTVYIGSDNHGYKFKKHLIRDLKQDGLVLVDLGVYKIEEQASLEVLGREVGEKVSQDPESIGILIQEKGLDMCIIAYKMADVHSTVCLRAKEIEYDTQNCNTLCLNQSCMDYPDSLLAVRKLIHYRNDHKQVPDSTKPSDS